MNIGEALPDSKVKLGLVTRETTGVTAPEGPIFKLLRRQDWR